MRSDLAEHPATRADAFGREPPLSNYVLAESEILRQTGQILRKSSSRLLENLCLPAEKEEIIAVV